MEEPVKGYFRLFPGNKVRLRYGYVVECTGCDKDENGNVIAVHCNYFADSKSGTEGSANYKVKGNIHWVNAADALKPKCACTTACSPMQTRMQAAKTSWHCSIQTH
jgi:glutaminyl-tRNA synthetase